MGSQVMKFSRFTEFFALFVALLGSAFAANPGKTTASENQAPAILPQQFGGWQLQGSIKTSNDPAAADASNAAVLKEYGLTDVAAATYTRDDGRTLKIRAARFADASGAFGAYTFYLQPDMTKEDVGDQAASSGNRVLFYHGHILVDAQFSKESPMSGAELRELAGALPRAVGSSANLPSFIEFMPRRDYVPLTQKYVMGPVALNALQPAVSAEQVDFGASAEVSLARYNTPSGEATLTLISYPTPQLAAEHRRRLNAEHQLGASQAGESEILCAGDFCDKRTGPIVAVATGTSASDAKSLLGRVNYEASVTWNTPTESGQVHDLYMLILNIVILCAILAGLAIIAGIAFGGIRILTKRFYPDKIFDRPEQMEFISLRLTERAIVEETIIVEGTPEEGREQSRELPRNPS